LLGVIEFDQRFRNLPEMLKKLDEALYRAKKESLRVALAS